MKKILFFIFTKEMKYVLSEKYNFLTDADEESSFAEDEFGRVIYHSLNEKITLVDLESQNKIELFTEESVYKLLYWKAKKLFIYFTSPTIIPSPHSGIKFFFLSNEGKNYSHEDVDLRSDPHGEVELTFEPLPSSSRDSSRVCGFYIIGENENEFFVATYGETLIFSLHNNEEENSLFLRVSTSKLSLPRTEFNPWEVKGEFGVENVVITRASSPDSYTYNGDAILYLIDENILLIDGEFQTFVIFTPENGKISSFTPLLKNCIFNKKFKCLLDFKTQAFFTGFPFFDIFIPFGKNFSYLRVNPISDGDYVYNEEEQRVYALKEEWRERSK